MWISVYTDPIACRRRPDFSGPPPSFVTYVRGMNSNELWLAVLGELELSLSKANFTTWFKNTFIASIAGEEIIIGVPNLFTKAWLEKKYHRDILISLQHLTDQRVRVVSYRVETRSTTPLPMAMETEPATNLPETPPEPVPSYGQPASTPISFPQAVAAQETAPPTTQAATPAGRLGEFSINAKYTFTNYIVGKQNELAHAAAQAVSGQPGGVYNPLFIYGGVGLGKTHLVQAVGNEILRRNPGIRVLYVTSERFTTDYINSVRNGQGRDFRSYYRGVDLLLVDDIQFLTGKEGTQEEFFHTFNQLHQNNKQIVITSDRPPKAIPALESRLVSRFECGMMADIGSPDFETRVAILEQKCREKSFSMAREILHHIATSVQNNVRELEGALNKVIAFHHFKNTIPTLDSVRPILSSFSTAATKKTVTAKHLIQTVAEHFDLHIDDLLGKSREKRFAFPRQIIMYLMREEMKSSYPSIGAELGGRDHTTAIHAYDKIMNKVIEDEQLQHDLELIRQRLYTV